MPDDLLDGLTTWKPAKDVSPDFANVEDVFVSSLGHIKRDEDGSWKLNVTELLPLDSKGVEYLETVVSQGKYLLKRLESGWYN